MGTLARWPDRFDGVRRSFWSLALACVLPACGETGADRQPTSTVDEAAGGRMSGGAGGYGGRGGQPVGGSAGQTGTSATDGAAPAEEAATTGDPPCGVCGYSALAAQCACVTDSDCVARDLGGCCQHEVVGQAQSFRCAVAPTAHCDDVSCTGSLLYMTDDGRSGQDPSGISARCDQGRCVSVGPWCADQPCRDGVCLTGPCGEPIGCTQMAACDAGSDDACGTEVCRAAVGYGGAHWISSRDLLCMMDGCG